MTEQRPEPTHRGPSPEELASMSIHWNRDTGEPIRVQRQEPTLAEQPQETRIEKAWREFYWTFEMEPSIPEEFERQAEVEAAIRAPLEADLEAARWAIPGRDVWRMRAEEAEQQLAAVTAERDELEMRLRAASMTVQQLFDEAAIQDSRLAEAWAERDAALAAIRAPLEEQLRGISDSYNSLLAAVESARLDVEPSLVEEQLAAVTAERDEALRKLRPDRRRHAVGGGEGNGDTAPA